jgi:xylose dehydrogenase (NAD/NADP)
LNDIRAQEALAGGAHMDVGAYVVSGARLVAREDPVRVYAEGRSDGSEVDLSMVATLRFPSGVLAVTDCSMQSVFRYELEAIGDSGAIHLDDPWTGRLPRIEIRRNDQTAELVDVDGANPYTREVEDFEASVRGGRPPRYGNDDVVAQAATLAGIYQSMREGRPVELAACA